MPDIAALIAQARGLGGLSSTVQAVVDGLADALEASVQAPAVDREALKRLLVDAELASVMRIMSDGYPSTAIRTNEGAAEVAVDAVLASGILLDAREVEARGLEKAADEFWERLPDGTGNGRAYNSHRVATMLRARAQQVREGDASTHDSTTTGEQ